MCPLADTLDRLVEAATLVAKERKLKSMVLVAERKLAAAFDKQGREFLARLSEHRNRFGSEEALVLEKKARRPWWEPLFDEAELATVGVFEEPITAIAQAALEAGARMVIADLAVDMNFDLESPAAVAFLKDRAASRVTMINETTRAEMRTVLTEAMDKGWSYDKTARQIKQRFDGFAGKRPQAHIQSRAHLVAVTESGDAYEAGSHTAVKQMKDLGLEMEHSWLTVGDSRVDPKCRGNQGAGWLPIGEAFPSGHERPLAHPACRCTALYRRQPTE